MLEETLRQTTLPDTAAVAEATKKLNQLYKSAELLPAMLDILVSNQDTQMRQLAAVEAKKLVDRHWETTAPLVQEKLKTDLLRAILAEPAPLVAHSAGRVVVAVIGAGDQWPGLVEALVQAVNGAPQQKLTALYVLYLLLDLYQQLEEVRQHKSDLFGLLAQHLGAHENLENRVHALLGVMAVAASDLEASLGPQFQEAVPLLVAVLHSAIEAQDERSVRSVFTAFHDMHVLEARVAGDLLLYVVKVFVEIAMERLLDEEVRGMALQFLIRTVALKKSRLASAKGVGLELALAALEIGCDPVDPEEELDDDNEDENEESTPLALGLRLLAELASELPPSLVVSPVFARLEGLVSSPDLWRARGGLLAIGLVLPGAPEYVSNNLPKFVPLLVHGLKHSEAVVRLAALKSIYEMSGELQNGFAEYHATFLPVLMETVQTATHQSVYRYATFCVDGIVEYMEQEAVVPYLGGLVARLLEMLAGAQSALLRTAIVSALGLTAFAAGKHYAPYFEDTLRMFEPFMKIPPNYNEAPVDDIELVANTMENLSIVARAVGAEAFSSYAEGLINASYECVSTDNPRLRECAFALITNLTKVYGEDFLAVLPKLIPEIVKCLEQDELVFTGNFDDDGEIADIDDIGDNIQVRTGVTLEKEIAAVALGQLASATKQSFMPYVETVVECLMEQSDLINFGNVYIKTLWDIVIALYENTRESKFPVGAVAGLYIPEELLKIVKAVRDLTIELLKEEYELYTVKILMMLVEEALAKMGAIAVMDSGDLTLLEQLCVELMKILKGEHFSQNLDEEEAPRDEDADESEADVMVYEGALDVLVVLLKALGSDFNRIFASFKPVMYKAMLSPSKQKRSVTVGALAEICVGIKDSNPDEQELLELFTEALEKDPLIAVKGLAAYGVGVVAFNLQKDFSGLYPRILALLLSLLQKADTQPKSIDDEDAAETVNRLYANACGCVARLALKNIQAVPLADVIPVLLEHLPLALEFEENTPIFNLLIELYQNHLDLVRPYNQKILAVFKHAFKADEDRVKLEQELTIGREQNIDSLKQFPVEGLREKVVELVGFIEKM